MELNDPKSINEEFSQRKRDHIEISLKPDSQAYVDQFTGLAFSHNPIPEINFDEVEISTSVFGHKINSPFFVSSMTLGHEGAQNLNDVIFSVAHKKGWMAGVGSQRRELFDPEAFKECEALRKKFPGLILFGNIGLSQIIDTPIEKIQALVNSLNSQFLVVHTNPLQEVIQAEGTPQFKGGLKALEKVCQKINVPVVLKETGCGFSIESFERLKNIGLSAIDVSGLGGTHWGRVEGLRQNPGDLGFEVAKTFSQWGVSTVDSVKNATKSQILIPLWASGGVRNGLDGAKLMALGAQKIGFAQPILQEAVKGVEFLEKKMTQLDYELKVVLFCLGLTRAESLVGQKELLQWK